MDFDRYVDPLFLDRITYIDSEGKRRVKNPYRNRKSYDIIVPSVNDAGNFIFVVPESVVGKSVFVEFPNKVMYQFTVNPQTNEVTVIGVPPLTYIEINVVNPQPLPPSDDDLYWDELGYDAQKAIVAAWGDIDLICNVLYPSSVEVELDFDDQNTLKYGLVGWKNNCGNDKNTNWGRPMAPPNRTYFPPQPVPTPPPPPPPPDPDVGHDYDFKFVLRWENNSMTDLDFHGFIDHDPTKRVWFGGKEYGSEPNKMWLDVDYTKHDATGRESQPEIITVIGFPNSTVSLQIDNFNRGVINEDVTVEIFDASQTLLKKYTIPSYALSGAKRYWVCDINLATKTIVEKMKEIPSTGTFN
jgi:hypothetical protein